MSIPVQPIRRTARSWILASVTPFVTGGAGFLLAVLWFDLMFDVQVLEHRAGDLPEEVLTSIAGYYRRVTTSASPMNRLVAAAMLASLVAIGDPTAGRETPAWVSSASIVRVGLLDIASSVSG